MIPKAIPYIVINTFNNWDHNILSNASGLLVAFNLPLNRANMYVAAMVEWGGNLSGDGGSFLGVGYEIREYFSGFVRNGRTYAHNGTGLHDLGYVAAKFSADILNYLNEPTGAPQSQRSADLVGVRNDLAAFTDTCGTLLNDSQFSFKGYLPSLRQNHAAISALLDHPFQGNHFWQLTNALGREVGFMQSISDHVTGYYFPLGLPPAQTGAG